MSDHPYAPDAEIIPFPGERRAGRALPYSEEAERAVVGGILLQPRAFAQVGDIVSAHDFFHPAIGAVFAAMETLDRDGKPIDRLTVAMQMDLTGDIGKLRAHGGDAFLSELMADVFSVENIAYHANTVRTLAHNRRVLEAASEVVKRGYGDGGREDDYADEAGRTILDATQAATRTTYESARKLLGGMIKTIEQRYERKQAVTGVPTGFHKLDALTAGLQPGDLVIVAARPSMGKTSLVLNAAMNAAIEHKIPSLIFSLEMSKESLLERGLSSEARVDSTRLRTGFFEQRDWVNLTKGATRIADAPLWFDDKPGIALAQIRAKARRWRQDKAIFPKDDALGMVVVDYLQLIQGRDEGKERNREREVADFSRGLKALAKELKCPVVALSQLNRGVESRADKRPNLSDLRESGALEQDADVIAFIYRDEVYNPESPDKGVAEVIIGKQRTGAIGTVRLAFLAQYTKFENLRDADDEAPRPVPQPRRPRRPLPTPHPHAPEDSE